MGNFSKNPDKLSYAYLLTTMGVAEKAVLTRRFLQRNVAEYERLRGCIGALQLKVTLPLQTAQANLVVEMNAIHRNRTSEIRKCRTSDSKLFIKISPI